MAVVYGEWEKIERKPSISFVTKGSVLIKGWWSADKEGEKIITKAFLEDTVYFHIVLMGKYNDGDKLSLQLYDYDSFMWFDYLNTDDKIENPKECTIKDGKVVLKVYLKPQWKEYIDDVFFGADIDLYWNVDYNKENININLPSEEKYYLRVTNNRNIYIKPACPEKEYYFPEIYSFSGEMIVFADILEDWSKGYMGEKISKKIQEWTTKKVESIVLAKLNKGQLGTNFKKVIQGAHKKRIEVIEHLADGRQVSYSRAPNRGTGVKGETTKGILQYSFFEQSGGRVKGLFLLKEGLGMFADMKDLFDFAKGGDISDATANVIMLLIRSANPLLGLFVSVGMQILIDPIIQTRKDWMKDDIETLMKAKNIGILKLLDEVHSYEEEKLEEATSYHIKEISTEVMQALLDGTIKNRKQLSDFSKKYPHKSIKMKFEEKFYFLSEVYMLFKEDNGMIIDSFLTNK